MWPFRARVRHSPIASITVQPPALPIAPETAAVPMPAPRAGSSPMAESQPFEQALSGLLAALQLYLPAPVPPLPSADVSVVGLTVRSAGLGGLRGYETLGSFAVRALKGIRLEAVVRFTLWGADPNEVDGEADQLHGRLLAARDTLWSAGVMQLRSTSGSVADSVESLNGWRRTTDYLALYEFRYADSEDAESIIARIPINGDLEVRDSLARETTVVTDEIVRWDNEFAPLLSVRGPATLAGLALLDDLPPPLPAGSVTLLRTFDGASGAPSSAASLTEFLSNLADSAAPARHLALTFATLGDLLSTFTATDEITLGDWNTDGTPDRYTVRTLAFNPLVVLPSVGDRLEIKYELTALDQVRVIYLRAGRA
jgi:hypothetical protein